MTVPENSSGTSTYAISIGSSLRPRSSLCRQNFCLADSELKAFTAHVLDQDGQMELTTSGNLEAVCGLCLLDAKAETSVFNSRNRRSRRWREVTYLPSLPASGLSFTMKFMEIVGSEIFWNGMETGLSRSPQRVSPMWISGIPETATIEPMPASVTSTFFSPSNSYSLLTFTFFSSWSDRGG